jgi:alkylation response protein AidB-like acyl-CoA dehydrogenase
MSETMPNDVVAAATALAPQIHAVRDRLETERRLPAPVVQALARANLLQLYLPRAMGGPEVPPLTAFRAIEALSQADGSVGWCALTATSGSLALGWLDPEAGRALVGQPPDLRLAGAFRPVGSARPVDGGYRVTGRWDFASGIDHANWLVLTCAVVDAQGPRLTPAGTPEVRTVLVPPSVATVEDTWSVVGLCGTGSQDVILEEVFVAAEQTVSVFEPPPCPNPLYTPRLFVVTLWTPFAGNALGMARGAVDAFIDLATRVGSASAPTLLRDRPWVQAQVGAAEAILRAARAYVLEAVGTVWEAVCDGKPDPRDEIAHARLAITHAIREAVRAVDLVFHAAGTNAIYRKHPLERFFRDSHVAVQHIAGMPAHIEAAGQVLLGLRPSGIGW